MSNRSTHIAGAAFVVNVKEGYSLYNEMIEGKEINFQTVVKRLVIANIAGTSGVLLPDIFEPAANPHHRKFYHSILVAALLIFLLVLIYKKTIVIKNEDINRGVTYLGIGYSVHLVQDSMTPFGLPLI